MKLSLYLFFALASLSAAATLTVGPGQQYDKPSQAIEAAADGDTILIDAAGDYNGDVAAIPQRDLTLRGVNGRPHIDAAGRSSEEKAIWVIDGNNVTVENIEFSGETVSGGNGAGIRGEGGNLTVRNCYFHDNQMGILTANLKWGEVLVEYSEFARNGTNNAFTHNIYIGEQAKFTMRFCYSHDAKGGQLVKTRAAENHILYNRLTAETLPSNYELDVPNGGLTYVIGNLIEQGPGSKNPTIMEYLLEGTNAFNPDSRLFVINNTFVNSMKGGTFINIGKKDGTPAVIQNNIFYGAGQTTTQANAIKSNNFSEDPHFVNAMKFDYRLQPDSPAINAGTIPASGAGQDVTPHYEYVDPTCGEVRGSALDIGALQSGAGAGARFCTSPNQ